MYANILLNQFINHLYFVREFGGEMRKDFGGKKKE